MKPIYTVLCVFVLACQNKDAEQATIDDIPAEPEAEQPSNEPETAQPTVEPSGEDNDQDGYGDSDCNDNNPNIHPGAVDYSGDGIDQNCDGIDEKGLCSDTCNFAGDNTCDDGGSHSQYDVCALGTDCSDCGVRKDKDEDGFYDVEDCNDADPNSNPNAIDFSGDGIDQDCDGQDFPGLCLNTCSYANDQTCDDGGPNSDYSLCALGTDCVDCGPRQDGDGDGYDISEDCNDYSSLVHPGAIDNTCDGIDQNCNGVNDEDWNGDGYEPNDITPYNLGTLYDGGSFTNLKGYITDPYDEDSFSFYYYDSSWDLGFGLDIELSFVPNQLDLILTLNHIDRTGKDTLIGWIDVKGLGGSESITFNESYGNDETGTYIVRVFSASGATCSQSYTLNIFETGIY